VSEQRWQAVSFFEGAVSRNSPSDSPPSYKDVVANGAARLVFLCSCESLSLDAFFLALGSCLAIYRLKSIGNMTVIQLISPFAMLFVILPV